MAAQQGAEAVDFSREDPVEAIRELTRGIGVDRAIDVVGVDALAPQEGPAAGSVDRERQHAEMEQAAPQRNPKGDLWVPGNAPSQALDWAIAGLAKAGTLGIIGVYPETMHSFPLGKAMNRNVTVKMGNCNHKTYIPHIVELIRSGAIDPE